MPGLGFLWSLVSANPAGALRWLLYGLAAAVVAFFFWERSANQSTIEDLSTALQAERQRSSALEFTLAQERRSFEATLKSQELHRRRAEALQERLSEGLEGVTSGENQPCIGACAAAVEWLQHNRAAGD